MKHVAIIGNGISGITAARQLRKKNPDTRITVISAESKYFFSRTALMYIYMGHMKYEHTQPYEPHFWEKNRIELIQDYVQSIDFDSRSLSFKSGGSLDYDELIIATGSKPNKFGWPGQNLDGVQGLYSYQDLQLLEKNTHPPFTAKSDQKVLKAVIVGGGLIGVELAEMLLTRNIEVTFLVRENTFWGNVLTSNEGRLIADHMNTHGVELRFETELVEIIDNGNGRVGGVKTSRGDVIDCELVGLTAGVSPNIEFLRESKLDSDRGILVDPYLKTNIDGVYAIGDCAQFRKAPPDRRNIEQVWYTGRMMGEVVAETISGNTTIYNPGPWFNSAKFFDIEYQTYGRVNAEKEDGEMQFFWKHPTLEIFLTISYDADKSTFLGLNTFGIRMRHELMDRWLREGKSVEYVLEHLSDANFDPEFYRRHEKAVVQEFKLKTGKSVSLKKKSWKRILGVAQ